jgi:hypothetical protein
MGFQANGRKNYPHTLALSFRRREVTARLPASQGEGIKNVSAGNKAEMGFQANGQTEGFPLLMARSDADRYKPVFIIKRPFSHSSLGLLKTFYKLPSRFGFSSASMGSIDKKLAFCGL